MLVLATIRYLGYITLHPTTNQAYCAAYHTHKLLFAVTTHSTKCLHICWVFFRWCYSKCSLWHFVVSSSQSICTYAWKMTHKKMPWNLAGTKHGNLNLPKYGIKTKWQFMPRAGHWIKWRQALPKPSLKIRTASPIFWIYLGSTT